MKYVCSICGYVYDEAAGKKWEELPDDWVCPLCRAPKSAFHPQLPAAEKAPDSPTPLPDDSDLRKMTAGEMSSLCSNLAKGCEKQYQARETELFMQLSEYYRLRTAPEEEADISVLLKNIQSDLEDDFPASNDAAKEAADRGALRVLVWSEKVTRMLQSILTRYENEGPGFLAETNVYVCDICGFIYVGDTPPDICPVCKVPSFKILKVQRG